MQLHWDHFNDVDIQIPAATLRFQSILAFARSLIFLSVPFKMKFSALPISIFLWAFTALAADPLHRPSALNNVKNILERRLPNRPFQHPELRKRATRFLNDKTKGDCNSEACVKFLMRCRPRRRRHCYTGSRIRCRRELRWPLTNFFTSRGDEEAFLLVWHIHIY